MLTSCILTLLRFSLSKLCNKDAISLAVAILFYKMICMFFGDHKLLLQRTFSFRPRQFESSIIYGALTDFMMPLGGQAVVLRRLLLVEHHSCILMETSNSGFFFGAVAKSFDCLPQRNTTKKGVWRNTIK